MGQREYSGFSADQAAAARGDEPGFRDGSLASDGDDSIAHTGHAAGEGQKPGDGLPPDGGIARQVDDPVGGGCPSRVN